jgi:predicted MFS family arabinose efflux permease
MTLYLQSVLHFAPLTTGLIFGVPGLAAVAAGIIAGRFIGRYGPRNVLAVGLLVQTGFTAPLIFLGASNVWICVLIPALFVGFFGHVTAIVACMVTATSDVPDSEQGLATGLASMTQQIGITFGIPILGAVAATQPSLLSGIHLALAVNVLLTLTAVVLIWSCLRPRPEAPTRDAGTGKRTSLRPIAAA